MIKYTLQFGYRLTWTYFHGTWVLIAQEDNT